ncbi:basic proline-rich protein-like [Myiozetetes cayanensis]|uniref:basic proline-rich protein-like n=1 Tax=Myiozetetes cayanensis TaxID=478635 RepID=UPI00215FD151|nr:basic proline-rich protein-like [Myiozetetes cayanensis]
MLAQTPADPWERDAPRPQSRLPGPGCQPHPAVHRTGLLLLGSLLPEPGYPLELGPRPDRPPSLELPRVPAPGCCPSLNPAPASPNPALPPSQTGLPQRHPPPRTGLTPPSGTRVPLTPPSCLPPVSALPPGSARPVPAPAPGCGPAPCTGLRSRFSARSARPAGARTELPPFSSRPPQPGCLPPPPPRLPGQVPVPVPPRGGRWVPRAAVAHGSRTHTHTHTRVRGAHTYAHTCTHSAAHQHLLCTYPVQQGPLRALPDSARTLPGHRGGLRGEGHWSREHGGFCMGCAWETTTGQSWAGGAGAAA